MAEQNLGGIAWTVDADTSGAVNSVNQMEAVVDSATGGLKKLDTQTSKTSRSVKTALSGMGKRAGMAGIQMQQFIGQIQGGQSAMVALSQQAADLGFVLGVPLLGAVAGIAASLVGMLIPSLFETDDNTEELLQTMRELNKEMALTPAQIATLVNAEQELIDKRKESNKVLLEEISLLKQRREQAGTDEGILGSIGAQARQAAMFGESEKELDRLNSEIDTNNQLNDQSKQKIKDLVDGRGKSIEQIKEEAEAITRAAKALQRLDEQLNTQVATLGMSNREVAHYKASMLGATGEMHRQIDAIYDHQEALKFDQEQLKANTEEEKRRLAKMKEVAAWQAQRRAEAADFAGGIAGRGMTEGDVRAQENARLDELRQQDLISEEEYNNAKIQMNREYAQAVQAVNGMVLSSVSSLTSDLMANMDEQSGAYKALFAIQKAAAVAQAIVAAELAANQVMAHDAGILGLGALATSNIVRGMGYASAGVIAGTAIAGGREHGGSMLAGSTYEVGEKNKPELLMIPGNNGKMFSNAEVKGMMSGGGSSLPPIINNYMGGAASVHHSRDPLTQQDVFAIVDARLKADSANPNSHMRRNLTSGTNIQNTISGGRR